MLQCHLPPGIIYVQYRGGYPDACRGYLEYHRNVQYRGGYHDKCGEYLEYRRGDIMSTMGDTHYCEECHDARGGIS